MSDLKTITQEAQQLKRILYLLQIIPSDMEWFAMGMPPKPRRIINGDYKNRINYVRSGFLSLFSGETQDVLQQDLTSEHVKDMIEWIDMGMQFGENLRQAIEIVKAAMQVQPNLEEKELEHAN